MQLQYQVYWVEISSFLFLTVIRIESVHFSGRKEHNKQKNTREIQKVHVYESEIKSNINPNSQVLFQILRKSARVASGVGTVEVRLRLFVAIAVVDSSHLWK